MGLALLQHQGEKAIVEWPEGTKKDFMVRPKVLNLAPYTTLALISRFYYFLISLHSIH